MSNEKILTKAIQKASEGGYTADWKVTVSFSKTDSGEATIKRADVTFSTYAHIIFNHDFAKALWPDPDGEDEAHEINDNNVTIPGVHWWQYHLQAMVISPDPIKYLGDHLND